MPAVAGAQAAPRQPAPPASTRPQPAPAPGSTPRTQTADPGLRPRRPPRRRPPHRRRHRRSDERPARPGLSPVQTAPAQRCRRSPPASPPTPSPPARSAPVKAPGPQITLGQAVDLALTYQPRVCAGRAGHADRARPAAGGQGSLRHDVHVRAGADYTQQPVAPGFLKQQLNNRDADEAAAPRLHPRQPAAARHPRQLERAAAALPARLQLPVRHRRHHARRPRRGRGRGARHQPGSVPVRDRRPGAVARRRPAHVLQRSAEPGSARRGAVRPELRPSGRASIRAARSGSKASC